VAGCDTDRFYLCAIEVLQLSSMTIIPDWVTSIKQDPSYGIQIVPLENFPRNGAFYNGLGGLQAGCDNSYAIDRRPDTFPKTSRRKTCPFVATKYTDGNTYANILTRDCGFLSSDVPVFNFAKEKLSDRVASLFSSGAGSWVNPFGINDPVDGYYNRFWSGFFDNSLFCNQWTGTTGYYGKLGFGYWPSYPYFWWGGGKLRDAIQRDSTYVRSRY
jgi:hypothetical protein